MKSEQQKLIYREIIRYPTKTDKEVGESLGISRSSVQRIRKQLLITIDYELARNVAGKFMAEFQMASDYFKTQVENLEERKKKLEDMRNSTKTIFKKAEDGHFFPEQIDLEVSDLLSIDKMELELEKHQTELWKDIIFLARQSEAVEIIKGIQDGRIKPNQPAVEARTDTSHQYKFE